MTEPTDDFLADQENNFIEKGPSREERTFELDSDLEKLLVELKERASDEDRQRILAMEQQIAHQKASMEQVYTERETNHRTVLKEQLYRQFRVVDDNFHFKDQPGAVAFKDKGERIISASNDDRVTQAMATMAEAKGWKTIKVSGHPDFQRKIWMEANLRGIEVQGYKPTQQERQQLDDMRDRRMQNAVLSVSDVEDQNQKKTSLKSTAKTMTSSLIDRTQEHSPVDVHHSVSQNVTEKSSLKTTEKKAIRTYTGRVLDHGEAPYGHDPEKSDNYFVKLATDRGQKEVWGVDLNRAISEEKTKIVIRWR